MIISFIKTAIRSLLKNMVAAIINITGLSIAFGLFILLILYVNNELTTDSSHKKSDRIFRLVEYNLKMADTGAKFAPYINDNYAEVDETCRMFTDAGVFYNGEVEVPLRAVLVDSTYFKIFSHDLVLGSLQGALIGGNGIVLTETSSRKLFSNENPIGKFINWDEELDLIIRAVVKDPPKNSSISIDAFISFPSLKIRNENAYSSDKNWSLRTWLLLNENVQVKDLEKKLSPDLLNKFGSDHEINFSLQNLNDIYFDTSIRDRGVRNGNLQLIYLFLALAFFIIIVASINYINLTSAQANTRAKEVSIRKIVGAYKKHLIIQFLFESIAYVFISLVIGFLLAEFFIARFNLLAGTQLEVKLFYSFKYLLGFISGGIILGLIAGIYPSIILALFEPMEVIKGKISKSRASLLFRKILLILQFVISMTMVVVVVVIIRQVNYVKHTDLGFDKTKILFFDAADNLVGNNAFKDELMLISGVDMISISNGIPGRISNGMGDHIDGKDIRMKHLKCDENFLDLMGIALLEGTGFISDSVDIRNTYLLNESALSYLGWDDPFSRKIWGQKCVGIVKDFNFASLHQPIGPLFITYAPYMRSVCIKYSNEDASNIIQAIERIWGNYFPEKPFNYHFIDQFVDDQYKAEENLGRIIGYFTAFALLIAVLGLLGLTLFMIQNRTKEIGIRKVHGSSSSDIIQLFSFDFIKWLSIAFIISIPISWKMLDYWLQNFAYRVNIDWWVFALSGIISLVISLITIIGLTYRAANMNPVDSLRYE